MTEHRWYACCKCLQPICHADPRVTHDQAGLTVRAYCQHCEQVVMVVVKQEEARA